MRTRERHCRTCLGGIHASVFDARWPGCEELEAALRRLAASRDQHIELLVDLTPAGTEAAVLDALRWHGLGDARS